MTRIFLGFIKSENSKKLLDWRIYILYQIWVLALWVSGGKGAGRKAET